MRTSAKRKIYFSGDMDFSALPQTDFVFSPPAKRGLGNECGRASEIFDGDFFKLLTVAVGNLLPYY